MKSPKLKIGLIDPFLDQSHKDWARGLIDHSRHDIDLIAQSAQNWKWKMVSSGIYTARKLNESEPYDLILATDMLHVSQMKSMLSAQHRDTPIALYMHENQITYDAYTDQVTEPIYGWINYTSCLVADAIWFNSQYHRDSFLGALPDFLRQFPAMGLVATVDTIAAKSSVLHLGMNLDEAKPTCYDKPCFLWNHRWEQDKNPEQFFDTLAQLQCQGTDFDLIVCGKSYERQPEVFGRIRDLFSRELIHMGYADSRDEYLNLLQRANVMLVTSYQDFFGISVVEAMHHGCYPVVPDRLAYAEHLPADLRPVHVYSEGEIISALTQCLNKLSQYDPNPIRKNIARYDWSLCIDEYDDVMSKIATQPQLHSRQ